MVVVTRNSWKVIKIIKQNTRIPCFNSTVLYYDTSHCVFFNKLKFSSNSVSRNSYQHFSNNMCPRHGHSHILKIFRIFQTFSLLLYLLWWSVIFDIIIALVHYKPYSFKMTKLIDKLFCIFWLLHNWPFLCLSPSSRASLLTETQQHWS